MLGVGYRFVDADFVKGCNGVYRICVALCSCIYIFIFIIIYLYYIYICICELEFLPTIFFGEQDNLVSLVGVKVANSNCIVLDSAAKETCLFCTVVYLCQINMIRPQYTCSYGSI